MSMTTELIEKLHQASFEIKEFYGEENEETKLLIEAADTIQLLSEKLHASQMERSSQYYNGGWIPVSERLPEVNEEAYSESVLVTLKRTWYHPIKGMIHIIAIADYDENAISSDGKYMDTEGWILEDGKVLHMNEVVAWMPLPEHFTGGDADAKG